MKSIRFTAASAVLVAAFTTIVLAGRQQAALQGEGARLDGLIKAYTSEHSALVAAAAPGGAARGGLRIDTGPAGSPESAQKLADSASAFVKKLATINTAQLTHDEWITYGLVEYQARMDAETTGAYFWLPSLITPYGSPLRQLTAPFANAPLKTQADLDAYVAALNQLPATMRAYQVRLQQQADHGVVLPTDELRVAMPFIRSFSVAPASSPFSVKTVRLSTFAPDGQAAFQRKVDAAISGVVNPAIDAFLNYIDGPYRAKTVKGVGVSQYPGGAAFYQHLIHVHTGLDLTPQQIQDIGMREVARINGELDRVRQETGFAGTVAEFKHYLRTDPRFYAKSSQEIGDKMMAAIHLVEPKMSQYFLKMPKAPYGVRRLALELEPSMTYGYYDLPTATDPSGYYNYNGLNPETRSTTMVTAIIFHELLPGHHYQLTLRGENPKLTGLRKTAMYTAYTEGWGEDASDLAMEMGAYPDAWAKAGRLGMDLFTSSRLVVDTGMNALGWSRDRAMQFMKDNTFESDGQIDTETLRYSVDMPGQALAYKLGSLKIKEARERLRVAQGTSFDIRKFHDYFLDAGEMPLGMFDQHFTCLISGEQHRQ